MLSSSTSQNDIDLAYSLGVNAYFRKPMTLDSYVEQIRVLIPHWLDLAQLPSPGRPADRKRSGTSLDAVAGETGI